MKCNSYFLINVLIYIAGFCYHPISAQGFTRPIITERTCTSVTVSSTIFPSTVLPWGFDWRINYGKDTTVLVSVTIRSENEPFIITPGPASPYSYRYDISNHPNPISFSSTRFNSTVTLTGLKEGENLALSVPGLGSNIITSGECNVM